MTRSSVGVWILFPDFVKDWSLLLVTSWAGELRQIQCYYSATLWTNNQVLLLRWLFFPTSDCTSHCLERQSRLPSLTYCDINWTMTDCANFLDMWTDCHTTAAWILVIVSSVFLIRLQSNTPNNGSFQGLIIWRGTRLPYCLSKYHSDIQARVLKMSFYQK